MKLPNKIASRLLLLVWLSVSLHVKADAPPSRYTFPTPDTVYDTRTKLTWQRTPGTDTFTQSDAISYCSSLTVANGGWRLPTRAELSTLVDPTRSAPAIDPTAFPNTWATAYWTTTRFVPKAGNAWIIGFHGGDSTKFETTVKCAARCVR